MLLQIQIYQLILLGTKTNLGCMVDSVCAMLLVDALQQIGGIVLGRHLLLVDDVDTGSGQTLNNYDTFRMIAIS